MVHEMSWGEPLEECDCNECAETPEEEGPLGSPESSSSKDPKNYVVPLNHILLFLLSWEDPHIYLFLVKMIL